MVDVAPVFADPDRDSLVYAAVSSDPGRVMVGLAGSTLMLGGVAKGGAAVTVTASDPGGLEAEQMFMVTVPNRAPRGGRRDRGPGAVRGGIRSRSM